MRALTLVLAALLLGGSAGVAFAHGNHGPHRPAKPQYLVSEETAKELAKVEVERLIEADKIVKSWKALPARAIEKRPYEDGDFEWVVTFENKAVKEKEKRLLFIFLRPTGETVAANHTGK